MSHVAEYMTTEEAADYLKISAATLRARRLNGESPRVVHIGRSVRYRRTDLDAWATSLTREPTDRQTARAA